VQCISEGSVVACLRYPIRNLLLSLAVKVLEIGQYLLSYGQHYSGTHWDQ